MYCRRTFFSPAAVNIPAADYLICFGSEIDGQWSVTWCNPTSRDFPAFGGINMAYIRIASQWRTTAQRPLVRTSLMRTTSTSIMGITSVRIVPHFRSQSKSIVRRMTEKFLNDCRRWKQHHGRTRKRKFSSYIRNLNFRHSQCLRTAMAIRDLLFFFNVLIEMKICVGKQFIIERIRYFVERIVHSEMSST